MIDFMVRAFVLIFMVWAIPETARGMKSVWEVFTDRGLYE